MAKLKHLDTEVILEPLRHQVPVTKVLAKWQSDALSIGEDRGLIVILLAAHVWGLAALFARINSKLCWFPVEVRQPLYMSSVGPTDRRNDLNTPP